MYVSSNRGIRLVIIFDLNLLSSYFDHTQFNEEGESGTTSNVIASGNDNDLNAFELDVKQEEITGGRFVRCNKSPN